MESSQSANDLSAFACPKSPYIWCSYKRLKKVNRRNGTNFCSGWNRLLTGSTLGFHMTYLGRWVHVVTSVSRIAPEVRHLKTSSGRIHWAYSLSCNIIILKYALYVHRSLYLYLLFGIYFNCAYAWMIYFNLNFQAGNHNAWFRGVMNYGGPS
jgi:hypothetical protein